MISVIWIETPDTAVSEQGVKKAGASPIVDDDDNCVGILFTDMPPNRDFHGHIDIDENTFDGSAFVRMKSDNNGISYLHITK